MPVNYTEVVSLPNKDTLVLDRKQGDWRFGLTGGFNFEMYISDLKLPMKFYGYNSDSLINFPTGFGSGYFIGLFSEWQPPEKDWGAMLSIYFYDYRNSSSNTSPLQDSVKTRYNSFTSFNYISISPSIKYSIPYLLGLHLFGGVDLDFNLSSESKVKKEFEYTAFIDHDRKTDIQANPFTFGAHLGVGWDIFTLDFKRRFRTMLSPFVSVHAATSVLSDFGSSYIPLYIKAGLTIKIIPDMVKYDTLRFDSTYKEPPVYIASLRPEPGIEFPGFTSKIALPAAELSIVSATRINEEISQKEKEEPIALEEGIINRPEKQTASKSTPVVLNQRTAFTFPTSNSITLSKKTKDYLDAVAEFLKENPNSRVNIVGHADNIGTFAQQELYANQRAEQVEKYLRSKGVRNLIVKRGEGATKPAPGADINTPEGRAKNRRVEIVIQQ